MVCSDGLCPDAGAEFVLVQVEIFEFWEAEFEQVVYAMVHWWIGWKEVKAEVEVEGFEICCVVFDGTYEAVEVGRYFVRKCRAA